jgi:Glycosyltransferase family 9 (heptosyltransferase)
MHLRNPYGIEVDVPETQWALVRHDRPAEASRYRPLQVQNVTSGPANNVLLVVYENGIGDLVHAMPAIRGKIDAGVSVSVGCRDWQWPFYQRLGCLRIEESEPMMGTFRRYESEYGVIYRLKHWCRRHDEDSGGDVVHTRFEQFARLIGADLPLTFDFNPYLFEKERRPERPFDVVLGLDSSASQRTYPKHAAIYEELVSRHLSVRAMGLPDKAEGYAETLTMAGLIETIAAAKYVIAVDAGVLAIGLALGKPCVAIFGPTSEAIIVQQYARYRDMSDVRVVRAPLADNRCARPCNFSQRRGWSVNGKCMTLGDCMKQVEPENILREFDSLCQKPPQPQIQEQQSSIPASTSRPVKSRVRVAAKVSRTSRSAPSEGSLTHLPVLESNPS